MPGMDNSLAMLGSGVAKVSRWLAFCTRRHQFWGFRSFCLGFGGITQLLCFPHSNYALVALFAYATSPVGYSRTFDAMMPALTVPLARQFFGASSKLLGFFLVVHVSMVFMMFRYTNAARALKCWLAFGASAWQASHTTLSCGLVV